MHLPAFVIFRIFIFRVLGATQSRNFVKFDLEVVRQIAPKIILLEFGSNDLVKLPPETVGSELENLVRDLQDVHSVEVVVVGQVLQRRTWDSVEFNCKVGQLHQYLKVVLEHLPFCYYWSH